MVLEHCICFHSKRFGLSLAYEIEIPAPGRRPNGTVVSQREKYCTRGAHISARLVKKREIDFKNVSLPSPHPPHTSWTSK